MSLVSLAISVKLFGIWGCMPMNMAHHLFGDRRMVLAGMDWGRLGLLLVLCVISGLRLIICPSRPGGL